MFALFSSHREYFAKPTGILLTILLLTFLITLELISDEAHRRKYILFPPLIVLTAALIFIILQSI